MAQADYIIANAPGAAVRGDINDNLQAIVTLNSGSGAPADVFPYMFWADTASGKIKQRNAANTAWIEIGDIDVAHWNLLQRLKESGGATLAVGAIPDGYPVVRVGGNLIGQGVRRIRESGGADLPMGAVADGEFLKRVGSELKGDPSTVPPGIILPYGGTSAPTGYLMCLGTEVSRATYAALFAIIGTAFGSGNETTTFNLPNLQQRVPLGKAASGTGSTLGGVGGAIDHTHTGPSHNHKWYEQHPDINTTDQTYNSGGTAINFNGPTSKEFGRFSMPPGPDSRFPDQDYFTANAGTGATGTNNPPYQVVNYIIKT